MGKKRLVGFVGPAFIIASVVLGPGSVTAMSKAGASYGYSLLWLALLAGLFMAGFVVLFMRFGIYSEKSILDFTAEKWGRPFAAIFGLSMFYIVSAFQFGNNLGVATAMDGLIPGVPKQVWPVVFNLIVIVFLFGFKNIYNFVERFMMILVGVMILTFFINLLWVKPSPTGIMKGFTFTIPENADWVAIAGLVATTFSIGAAIAQSYLVREKGWEKEDYGKGIADAVSGIAMLTLIGIVIMATSAASLHARGIEIRSAADMAKQLRELCGPLATAVFCVGLAAASFSSFLVNAMIGGLIVSDGFNLGRKLSAPATKLFSALALLIGMVVALTVLSIKSPTVVDFLIAAQAGTLLAIPLAGAITILVLCHPDSMKGRRPLVRVMVWILVCAGVSFLLAMTAKTCVNLLTKLFAL